MRKMLTILLALGASLPFSSQISLAQSVPDAKMLLERVGVAYMNLKQYEFTMNMTLERVTKAGDKQVDTKSLKLTIRRPDKIRMEANGDNSLFGLPVNTGGPTGPMLLVGSGSDVWIYTPTLKRYGKVTAKISKEAAELVGNPSNWVTNIEQMMFSLFQNPNQANQGRFVGDERISLDGKDFYCYLVQFDSRRSKLWIDKNTYLVVRQLDQDSETKATTDFLFGRINVPLPDDLFVLSPSPDAKVEDLVLTRNPFR
jgi:outer membrane lipoprotein-sorting protein